jgi:hypothetical protein
MKMVTQDLTQVPTIGTTKITRQTLILKKNSLIRIITRKMRGSDARATTSSLRRRATKTTKTITITTITTTSKLRFSPLIIIPIKNTRTTKTRTILITRVDTKGCQEKILHGITDITEKK